MSVRAKAKKRTPYFTTEVEVEIDPHDLEEAGWVYKGDEPDHEKPADNDGALAIVRRWHDATHPDAWRFCWHEPCRDLPKGSDA